jgi:6-phosphogluconolactonase
MGNNMKRHDSGYGKVLVGDINAIFQFMADALNKAAKDKKPGIGLTGGSTPKAFYKWCAEKKPFSEELFLNAIWSVSDERFVPIEHDDSNFGTAEKLMLKPLGIANDRKKPWIINGSPEEVAEKYATEWSSCFGKGKAFDLCFLGMGDDCHTASIFPGSQLIETEITSIFSAVNVPEKGWRLSITPYGLTQCKEVIITVTGAGKKEALNSVFHGEYNPPKRPVQLTQNFSDRVTWLLDPAAADGLF